MPSTRSVPVTLAEIARIAGVGRAAVSNWRRRHDTFPARIGGTDASPQFSLAEIERWLRENDKLKEIGGRELLWPGFEALGSRDETGLAIAEAGRRMLGGQAPASAAPLSEQAGELVDEAVALGRREGTREVFEFLLQRWLDAHVRQVSASPRPLADLMAEVALAAHPSPAGDGGATVLDPACGAGHLLDAAARAETDAGAARVTLLGCDSDPALAALAAARLAFVTEEADATGRTGKAGAGGVRVTADVREGDSLRADPHERATADVVLCNPPFNERDWGYEELSTDRRWVHGLPPRTESELAWVQHALARLRPGGNAVLLLPPAVASRRAGRRIRGALLRAGLLRAVIALPPGCAQPHSVSLHLWLLRAPEGTGPAEDNGVLLADAAASRRAAASREGGVDWDALGGFVRTAVRAYDSGAAELPDCARRMAVIELLDDEVDLTPGRHVSPAPGGDELDLASAWSGFGEALAGLRAAGRALSALEPAGDGGGAQPRTTVGDLARAGALTLRGGQQPPDGTVRGGEAGEDGLPLLTVPDLLQGGGPTGWLHTSDVSDRGMLVARPGDVVVAGVIRAFAAWVHQGPPTVLGAQLYALRVDPEKMDPWFLAGCLRAPSNGRQAGTHASSASRVDVRRLQVLQLPLAEQSRYSEVFRRLTEFEEYRGRLDELASRLSRDISDGLAAGRLSAGSRGPARERG
ncbi:N-6 DNA methylase [Streptomyces chitinivorans]|uniref:N-6 DNA methylase n=1 Tax=Streptomyces chitinivorans TaxID=1257027 RepID=A0ABW7HYN5_9ACTN|nr:N-6 DNA methylase [Streptomyces chitinivorans]MDH2408021.1 N-6 DNA methylase [Streptomyces chitinivorans]